MKLITGLIAFAIAVAGCQTATPRSSSTGGPSSATRAAASQPSSSSTGTVTTASPAATVARPGSLTSDPLHALTVVDVRNGTSLTLGALAAERPLLIETMAIWCTNCRSQMHEVTAAHALADFASLSIDVEPYEAPADLAAYAAAEGFDWAFAKADAQVATALRERFGTAILNPPGMPKLLLRPDGSIELLPLNTKLSAAEIVALLG